MLKNHLKVILEAEDFAFFDQVTIKKERQDAITNFINLQPTRIKEKFISILSGLDKAKLDSVLNSFASLSESQLKSGAEFDKTCTEIFFSQSLNLIGKGELLLSWLSGRLLTTTQNYDMAFGASKIEIKSEATKNTFRFGSSKESTIQSMNFDDENGEINFWNEISHTINKIVKEQDKIFNSLDIKYRNLIKYIVGRKQAILNTSTLSPSDVMYLQKIFTRLNSFEVLKDDSYSRMALRGNYIKKKNVNIEPLDKSEIDKLEKDGGELTINVIPEDDSTDRLIGSLYDLFYVRHPEKFQLHLEQIILKLLKEDIFYIFFDSKGTVLAKGTAQEMIKVFELYMVDNSRVKIRLKEGRN